MRTAPEEQLSWLECAEPQWLRVRDAQGNCLRHDKIADGANVKSVLAEEIARWAARGWNVELFDAVHQEIVLTKDDIRRLVDVVTEEPQTC